MMEPAVNPSPKFKNSLICCAATEASCSTPTSTSSTDDECNTAPTNLLELSPSASAGEVRVAIAKCKDLVLTSAQCSTERARLVRRLIELRIRLEELKEEPDSPPSIDRCGHHFKLQSQVARVPRCDHCSGNIWAAVQMWYSCEACSFSVHASCVRNVKRACVHIILTENSEFKMTICPWVGLSGQNYKCHECSGNLSPSQGNQARLCDYNGRFYCTVCHWDDAEPIPARIIHNWDWTPRPVCRASKQLLNLGRDKRFIDIEKSNPKLFNFIAELEWVRNIRRTLSGMKKYLNACPEGLSLVTVDFNRLGDVNGKYSLLDLGGVNNGTLETELQEMTEIGRSHITNCTRCSGRGYICEICSNKEVLFPFDAGAESCVVCNSLYHRACWLRKEKKCVKCKRLEIRRLEMSCDGEQSDSYVDNDLDQWVDS